LVWPSGAALENRLLQYMPSEIGKGAIRSRLKSKKLPTARNCRLISIFTGTLRPRQGAWMFAECAADLVTLEDTSSRRKRCVLNSQLE
jgi:hypothetical protein